LGVSEGLQHREVSRTVVDRDDEVQGSKSCLCKNARYVLPETRAVSAMMRPSTAVSPVE
jgi:hypothetical protein